MAPTDSEVPCTIDHRPDESCLRCDFNEDEQPEPDQNHCEDSPCDDGCTCEDLYDMYYCRCLGDPVIAWAGAGMPDHSTPPHSTPLRSAPRRPAPPHATPPHPTPPHPCLSLQVHVFGMYKLKPIQVNSLPWCPSS